MPKYSYGYLRDQEDPRDFQYESVRPAAAPLPPSVDLRPLCSPVRDQGQLGSCTAFAIAVGLREFLLNKAKVPFMSLSPLFLYYEERKLENDIPQDAGARPRDGMKVLNKLGCAPEADDPYNPANFANPPDNQAVVDAKRYTIPAYHRIAALPGMKACLADGYGFVVGFNVYANFETDPQLQSHGIMPMPAAGDQVIGGHAVFVAGYHDDSQKPGGGSLICKNSWGSGWGDQGYFYMPYAFVTKTNVPDAWAAVK